MNEWEVSCAGKERYRSRAYAKEHAKKCALRGLRGLVPYRCGHCSQWHLGHRPGEATYRRGSAGARS